MGLDDGASPHSGRGSYLNASPPPYLSSHSPPPHGQGHSYSSYSDNIVYTPLGNNWTLCFPMWWNFSILDPVNSLLHSSHGLQGSTVSDLSNDSSPANNGYPEFPPSPDSWLGDTSGPNNSATNQTSVHYWLLFIELL